MKAYKIEVLVLDFEDMGEDEICLCLENTKYVDPSVISVQEADIGEWDDNHPLNQRDTRKAEIDRFFSPTTKE